jgi:LysR family hydrogen peroxide-inducible transcriptional activator
LAVAASDPLAKLITIKPENLRTQELLLLDEGHCLRAQALDVCNDIETISQQNFQATSLETLRHMVASGTGITLMPKLAQQKNDGIVYIPFAKPKPIRTIAMFWRKNSAQEQLLKELAEVIKANSIKI